MAEIDSLEIKLQANAQSANKSLSALIGKLDTLSTSLSKVSGNNLTSLSNGVQRLSNAMQSMKAVGTADFTRLSNNLEKLGSIDAAAIGRAASSMHRFTNALQSLDSVNVSDSAAQIGTLAKGISQLGYKSATQAIDNIPRLAAAMKQLMNTLSTAPRVSQNLIDMTNALANLSRAGVASGRVANSLSTSLNTYTKSADRAKKKTFSLASAMGRFYANFAIILRGINKAWDAAEKAMDYIETYNYYDVTLEKIGKEFGDNFKRFGADSAEEYAKSFSDRLEELTTKMTGYTVGDNGELFDSGSIGLGLDPNEIMSFQARIGAVTNSVGMLGENSINTAKALTMLSADMSSLTNTDLSTVMSNFQSGIIGQSRALYKYGIDITNATLQTYAYQYGITKAVSEMTQAEKMQLRLIAILDQSRVAWGDQANTINTAANQYRVLKQQVSNLARTIGNLFLPIITKVLPYVNAFVIVLNKLFTALGFKLFGDNWLKDVTSGINGGTGLDDFADDVGDVADGLDDATGAAKKFKNQLQGFDELNVLTTSDSAAGAGSTFSDLIDLTDAISDLLGEYESMWNEALAQSENKANEIAQAIIDAFKKAYESDGWKGVGKLISDWLTNALDSIDWESIYQGAKDFAKGLAEFLNGLITPDLFGAVGRTIAGALNTAIYAALEFGKDFDFYNFGVSIGTGINEFFETFDFKALAETLNTWVDGLKDAIRGVLDTLTWDKIIEGMTDFLGTLELDTVEVLIGAFLLKKYGAIKLAKGFLKGIKNVISGKLSSLITASGGLSIPTLPVIIQNLSFAIGNFALANSGMIGEISLWIERNFINGSFLDTSTWTGLAKEINDGINWLIDTVMQGLGDALRYLLESIFNWDIATGWFEEAEKNFEKGGLYIVLGILDGILGAAMYILEPIGDFFLMIWNGLCDVFGIHSPAREMKPIGEYILLGIVEGFSDKVSEFVTAITNWFNTNVKPWFTKEKWSELWQNVKTAFSTKWNEIKEWWNNTALVKWWNEDVTPWFTKEKWLGILQGVSDAFKGIWDGVKKSFDVVFGWIFDGIDSLTKKVKGVSAVTGGLGSGIGSVLSVSTKSIPAFATGGFPEDGLFYANHNELVGQFSNGKTAVANNEQITDGIYSAVRDANYETNALLRSLIQAVRDGNDISLSVNGRELGKVIQRENRIHRKSTGRGLFDD